jgi:glycosyltransferase involved in cell wall biosynthesis
MRILLVQDHLQTGGAAKCALRMQRLCRELGHEILALHGDETNLPGYSSRVLHGKPRGGLRLWEIVQTRNRKLVRRQERAEERFLQLLQDQSFDFVWFHNFAGARKWGWTEKWVQLALRFGKVVITLHDMEYLGVGAAYVWDRPVSASRFAGLDLAQAKELSQRGQLQINACSRWLGQLCLNLYGLHCGQLTVPLWPDDFRATAKRFRAHEGIHFLVAAEHLDDPRKNILPTLAILRENRILERTQSTLFCLGRNFPERLRSPRVVPLGHVEDRKSFRSLYEQIDFLLHPSLLDNFPLLIQESLAQGCPVVALDRGGVGEMVVKGRSGWLLADFKAESLEKTFLELARISPLDYRRFSENCLAFATERFQADRLALQYRTFLEEIRHA